MQNLVQKTLALGVLTAALGACTQYLPPEGWRADPVGAVSRLDARADGVPRLAVEGRVRAEAGFVSGDARVIALVERPDRLRVEVLSPTDDLLVLVTARAEQLVYWERGAATCYVGPPCAEHVERFLGIPLSVNEVVQALAGVPQPPHHALVSWDADHGRESLRWRSESDGQSREVLADVRTRLPSLQRWYRRGRRSVEVRWSDWQAEAGVPVARRMDVDLVDQAASVHWSLDVVDTELDGGEEAYRFTCPAGVEVLALPACRTESAAPAVTPTTQLQQ